MKDLLMLFGVTLAKRCNKRQKRIFYSQATPFFQKLGYKIEYQESQSRFNQISNIFIGNLAKAHTVVLCPYDTPTTSLLPFKYFPFNLESNLRQEYINLALNSLIYALCGGLLFYFIYYVSGFSPVLKVIGTILLALLLLFSYSLIEGLPNPINFNKNSASVALLASLAEKKAYDNNYCFILLDKNANSSAGFKLLATEERLKNKFLIYLDCLAFGEKITCVHKQETNPEARKLVECLQDLNLLDKVIDGERVKDTNLQFFPKMVHLCVGTIEKKKFVVLNTRSKKDFQVDIPRLEKIRDGLLKFLEDNHETVI
jgi:hypothetical protein